MHHYIYGITLQAACQQYTYVHTHRSTNACTHSCYSVIIQNAYYVCVLLISGTCTNMTWHFLSSLNLPLGVPTCTNNGERPLITTSYIQLYIKCFAAKKPHTVMHMQAHTCTQLEVWYVHTCIWVPTHIHTLLCDMSNG